MSNQYGFDFLQREHHTGDTGESLPFPQEGDQSPPPSPLHSSIPDPSLKSDLEKQFDVIQFLQAHRSSGCLSPDVIYKATGIDLGEGGQDDGVATNLSKNKRIRVEEVPDPENPSISVLTFGYQAKFDNIHEKTGLLAQINRCKNGVSYRDLSDAYVGVEQDLNVLITAGDVLAVNNPEDKDKTLFPRGEPFLVELDGNLFVPQLGDMGKKDDDDPKPSEEKSSSDTDDDDNDDDEKTPKRPLTDDEVVMAALKRSRTDNLQKAHLSSCSILGTDIDPRKQIRRGEAVFIAGQWFRISSAVREGVPLEEQPARAQAPPSVVLRKDLSKKNDAEGYVRPFTSERLPLDGSLSQRTIDNLKSAKEARETLAGALSTLRSITGKGKSNQQPSNLAFSGTNGITDINVSTVMLRKRPNHGKSNNTDPQAISKAVATAKEAANSAKLADSYCRRHGSTKDVRDMYLSTRQDVPKDELELYHLLIKVGLLDEGEQWRRPRMTKKQNLDNDGKPKKRRYYERKNQRITNTHLQGTDIGTILAQAAERQQMGKSVGDGGM